MKETYHTISKRDLNRLIKNGDVIINKYGNYTFHSNSEIKYNTMYTHAMSNDLIASKRHAFEYESIDLDNDYADDPFIDGISCKYGKWFVPIWCIVEWLKKRGIL